jgi:hypothetical protein
LIDGSNQDIDFNDGTTIRLPDTFAKQPAYVLKIMQA